MSKREYIQAVSKRYAQASKQAKGQILDEFCATLGYHRKAAIRVLAASPPGRPRRSPARIYGDQALAILKAIWEAADFPWSVRLKALLPLWLPWAKQRWAIPPSVEQQLLAISPRTIDRRLKPHRQRLSRRQYGRTKPGTLLKHHIPIKADRWEVTEPGFGEIDLVDHGGGATDGSYLHSLNFTEIASAWTETRAALGKSQYGVHKALEEIAAALPFLLKGLDSDNGALFINGHLFRYCQDRGME
jgi:hypothetical protein